jgi:D-alanine transaminase
MKKISYVNGKFVPHSTASVSIEDRGYVFSDGVYEVFQVRQGIILNGDGHMQRLQRSLAGLKIRSVLSPAEIRVITAQLLQHNNIQDAVIYLQVTRGVAPRNHAFPSASVVPSMVMTLLDMPKPKPQEYEQGVKVITHPDLRWKRRDLKTISLLPNILAKEEAAQKGAVEAVLIEDNKTVTEGSATNVYMVDNQDVVWTHPDDGAILGGITRSNLLTIARNAGIQVREETFTEAQLLAAKEAFLTSTTKHVLPVTKINDKPVGDGKVGSVTKQLGAMYEGFIDAQLEGLVRQ